VAITIVKSFFFRSTVPPASGAVLASIRAPAFGDLSGGACAASCFLERVHCITKRTVSPHAHVVPGEEQQLEEEENGVDLVHDRWSRGSDT